jgi:hypothetical protein
LQKKDDLLISLNDKKEKSLNIKLPMENKVPIQKIKTPKSKNILKKKNKISIEKNFPNEIIFTDKNELDPSAFYKINRIIVFWDEKNLWIRGIQEIFIFFI